MWPTTLAYPFDQFHDTIRFFVPQHRRQLVQSSDLMGCRSNPVPSRPAPNSVTISAVSNADDARLTRSRGRPTGFTAWRSRGWGANTEHPTGQTSVDIGWISEKVRSVWMFSTLVCLSQRPWNPEIFHGGSVCVHHCLAFRLPKGEKNNLTS